MVLSFIAFIFIFAVLQNSPWTHDNVYEQLPPLFKSSGSSLNLSEIVGAGSERVQAHVEDAWQYAIPGKETQNVKLPVPTARPVESPTKAYPPWVTDPSRTSPIALQTSKPAYLKEYMKKMLKWSRPSWDGHWPPFADYVDKAYDPNRWEQFKM
jgi:hypothetical protein